MGEYAAGAALLVVSLGLTLAGAWILARKWMVLARALDFAVGFAVLASIGVLAVHVVPLAFGIMGRGSVVAAALLWFVAAFVAPSSAVPEDPEPVGRTRRTGEGRFAPLVAYGTAALAGAFVIAFAANQVVVPSGSLDYGTFHMPDVARWIQTGSLWQITNYVAYLAPGNYPNNGDVFLLALTLPWHSDFAAHLVMYPFFVMTGVAVCASALRVGAPRSAALVAGCLVCAIPAIAVSSLTHAITDSVMLFGFAAGALFLLRHHQTGRTTDLVVAGLSLGLSFGTKWYAVYAVAILVAVWLFGRVISGRRRQTAVLDALKVSGLIALAGGIWLVRNWVESGNPVFPVKVAPFGVTIFDAPPDFVRELAGFTIIDYLGDWQAWKDFILPAFRDSLAAAALLAVAGALAALVALSRNGAWRRNGAIVSGLVMAALITVAYAATPYTAAGPEGLPLLTGANTRYVVPALVGAAVIAAWAAGRFKGGPLVFAVLGLLAVAYGIDNASDGSLSPARIRLRDWLIGFGLVTALVLPFYRLAGEGGWERLMAALRSSRRELAALAVAAGVFAVFVGHEVQERYIENRNQGADPVLEIVATDESDPIAVGITAVWTDAGPSPILPAFGTRLQNRVEYVGPIERELRRRYEEPDAFVEALNGGDYDLLIVGRGRTELPPVREDEWARDAGWRLVTRSDRFDLYLPPDPARSVE